ncbi:hypothetical protein FOPG_19299, partial [Fusarium oxysporum f. sp. conglutinans race 2 54008]
VSLVIQLHRSEQGCYCVRPVEDDELSYASGDESDEESDSEQDTHIGEEDSLMQDESEFGLLSEALFQLSMMF